MVWLAQANCYLKVVKSNKPNNADRLEPKVKRLDISVNFGNARTSEPLAERQNLTHWFGINMELGKPIYLPQRVSRPQGMPNGM